MTPGATVPPWGFLTTHAQVLICIARDPGIRLREVGDVLGITERTAHRVVTELAAAGYITRRREGRRNRYAVDPDLPLPDPIARERSVGELIEILAGESREIAG